MTQQLNNNAVRSIPPRKNHAGQPTQPPVNALMGGTTGGPNNYGQGRSEPVLGAYGDLLRQWRSGAGTSQQQYAQTRLPRRRA